MYLLAQRRIGTEQQLLACLTFGIEGTAYLCSTEGTVGQHTSIFTCKGNSLCYTLVDNIVADFCQTVYIGLTGTIVTTLDRIIEQTVYGVTIVLIVLGGIDTSLCSDRVSTTGRILDTEVEHIEAHLAQGSSSTGACQTGTYYDNVQLELVLGIYQALVSFIIGPFFSDRTFRYSRIDSCHI